MAGPHGYSKKQSQLARQKIDVTGLLQTATLDSVTNTTETLDIGFVAQKLTLSTTGGMSGTAQFSIDGQNWFGSMSISSTPANYNTNLVKLVKITCTGSTGTAIVAAV